MIIAILTKSTGILGPIVNLLGLIMNGIYTFFNNFGISNLALCIIVFTIITKTLMLPLTVKQQKFTRLSSRMNPELQKIQAKYKGKKDEASMKKQQAETSAVYAKYNASPLAGCLPMLIMLPILFALFRVINDIPAHVTDLKNVYIIVADKIKTVPGYFDVMMGMGEKLAVNTKKFTEVSENIISTDHIIDIMARFKPEHWEELVASLPSVGSTVSENLKIINHSNSIFGVLDIANTPGWGFPGILIPIISLGTSIIQSKQMEKNQPAKDGNDPSPMGSMGKMMPIMSGVFALILPIGVSLYIITSNVVTVVQQFFVDLYLDKKDPLPEMAGIPSSGQDYQSKPSKEKKEIEDIAKKRTKEINERSTENKEKTYETGSISDIANIMKNREKGEKK